MPLAIYRTLRTFTLEYLGLARALKKLCRDTGAKSGLTINSSGKMYHLTFHLTFRAACFVLRRRPYKISSNTAMPELRSWN
jgi:signal transduction histidine kinase